MMTPEMQTWLTTHGFVPTYEPEDASPPAYWEVAWGHTIDGSHVTFRVGVATDLGYDIILETHPEHGVNIGVATSVAQVHEIYTVLSATEWEQGPYCRRLKAQMATTAQAERR
jgi:hypothetical protein